MLRPQVKAKFRRAQAILEDVAQDVQWYMNVTISNTLIHADRSRKSGQPRRLAGRRSALGSPKHRDVLEIPVRRLNEALRNALADLMQVQQKESPPQCWSEFDSVPSVMHKPRPTNPQISDEAEHLASIEWITCCR